MKVELSKQQISRVALTLLCQPINKYTSSQHNHPISMYNKAFNTLKIKSYIHMATLCIATYGNIQYALPH